jgi:hypothetical protein
MRSGKKKILKRLAAIVGAVLLVGVGISIIVVANRKLPTDDLRKAREALAEAKEADANVYAEELFREAGQMYDSAMVNWARENERFILFRDYARVVNFAAICKRKADEAKEESIRKSVDLSKNVEAAYVSLDRKIELYNALFKGLPLSKSVIDEHNKAKMFLSESKIASEKGKLKDAEVLFKKAEIYLNHANSVAGNMLRDYFDEYPKWKRMSADAIAASLGGNRVILVDKISHKLFVYQSGKVVRSYDAEFGPNWMSHKLRNGDGATPEGNYQITSKKDGGRTIYHKALLLNYPNDEDRRKFAENKRKGLISRGAGIGGLIEIHGNGGRGFNWTSGCIGLKDNDIADLYRLVGVGTRVTIVGSTEPLSEVTKGYNF